MIGLLLWLLGLGSCETVIIHRSGVAFVACAHEQETGDAATRSKSYEGVVNVTKRTR